MEYCDVREALVFFFGSSEDQASLYLDEAVSRSRVARVAKHGDEMSDKEYQVCHVHLRMAVTAAINDGAPEEVVDELIKEYEETILYMIEYHEDFKWAINRGGHIFVKYKDHKKRMLQAFEGITGMKIK